MKKRNKLFSAVLAFVLSLSLLLLSGCLDITIPAKESAHVDSLSSIFFVGANGSLDICFFDNTVTYEKAFEPDDPVTVTLSSEDAAQYHELLKSVLQEMLDEGGKYAPANTLSGELTRCYRNVSVSYYGDDNAENDADFLVRYGEGQPRPARWGEFAECTKELTGCDVDELIFDPYDYEPQEVRKLSRVMLAYDKGSISLSFVYDEIYINIYGPHEDECFDFDFGASGYNAVNYMMRAICDDILMHESECSQVPPASDVSKVCQMTIEYSDGTAFKEKNVWLAEGGGRTYPKDLDSVMALVERYTGFDTADLIAAPGEIVPFGRGWRVSETVYAAPQYDPPFTAETMPEYSFIYDGSMFGNQGTPDSWDLISETVVETTLSEENFDDLFRSFDAASIREDTEQAWRYDVENDKDGAFCYLLATNSGELYLACGCGADGTVSVEDKESIINRMFRLECTGSLSA